MKQALILGWLCLHYSSGLLIKDWGTESQNKRLGRAVTDLFESALQLMNLGNPTSAMPMMGFIKNISVSDPVNQSKKANLELRILRSFLAEPQINNTHLSDKGSLRRIIMTRTEKMLHDKGTATHGSRGHQHEIVVCDSCIQLQFTGLHVGFHVESKGPSVPVYYYGSAVFPGSISYVIGFQLGVMIEEAPNNQLECQFDYKPSPLELTSHPQAGTVKGQNTVILADELEAAITNHLNTTVLENLNTRLDNALRYVATEKDLCTNFLTSGLFTSKTIGTRQSKN
ncbi:Hypothetical protein NTJ_07957 [Nesidiocoris tenuis]|uniref:Uncharacterized protein n=1 Tax=Nesidiocoris tenuis TaxID=355587 RepID=A0ABN7ASW6_9HEMI|nr:Hypothetical protein NTJ_07957 [Nesidiocoris tenuis]